MIVLRLFQYFKKTLEKKIFDKSRTIMIQYYYIVTFCISQIDTICVMYCICEEGNNKQLYITTYIL